MSPNRRGARTVGRSGNCRRVGDTRIDRIGVGRQETLKMPFQRKPDGRGRSRANERALTGIAAGAFGVLFVGAGSAVVPPRITAVPVRSAVIVQNGRCQGGQLAGRVIRMRVMRAAPEQRVCEHGQHRHRMNEPLHRHLPPQKPLYDLSYQPALPSPPPPWMDCPPATRQRAAWYGWYRFSDPPRFGQTSDSNMIRVPRLLSRMPV